MRGVGLLLPLLLLGCGSSKVAQCNQLAEVVNQTQGFMQEFEAEIQTFSESAAQVKNLDDIKLAASQYTTAVDKVVTNLDGLVGDLQSTTLRDEDLSQFRDEYVGVVQGFSTALTDAREAMDLVVQVESEAELPAKIEESQQQTMTAVASIETLSQTESQLINEVNGYCGAAQPVEPVAPSNPEGSAAPGTPADPATPPGEPVEPAPPAAPGS
ncbi:hypothetical protein [Nodosilinea sp. LEGE 06152]|uniref:hypothetical protein n=1 Tax=Nodosilinea sp. LEGE 06152 TaxID=2777966 RepID=UPI003242C17C